MPIGSYANAQLDENNTISDWLYMTNQMIYDFANIVVSPQNKYIVSNTEPTTNNVAGDLWYDLNTDIVKVYNGNTGTFVDGIADTSDILHIFNNLSDVSNTTVAIDKIGALDASDLMHLKI